jgi:CheY-like chemotaxis protein
MEVGDVLVVDDDPGVRSFIGFALEVEGIPYRTAAHGEQALACVAERRPGVILLDLDMPVLDGLGFCERLDATLGRDGTALVVMTASARAAQFQQRCHADATLSKPFVIEDLYAVVSNPRAQPPATDHSTTALGAETERNE